MRANSAIISLFPVQQKIAFVNVCKQRRRLLPFQQKKTFVYARKQRYKKLVPISTKEFFRWLAKHSIRECNLKELCSCRLYNNNNKKKIAFVYASKQRCLNPISTKTLHVNSATKMMLGTWIKSFTTFLFTWTQKALQK